jgi:hypothetical protein
VTVTNYLRSPEPKTIFPNAIFSLIPRRLPVAALMPPPKEPPAKSGVATRAANANKHPGIEASNALAVRTRRAPEVIQAEKDKKQANKEAKVQKQHEEAARKEIAKDKLDEYRARQAAILEDDEAPRQQTKGIDVLC